MDFIITSIRHSWPENANFHLNRENGNHEYVLLHFHSPCNIGIADTDYDTVPGSLVVYSPGVHQEITANAAFVHDWMHFTGDDIPGIMEAYGLKTDTIYSTVFSSCIPAYMEQLEHAKYANLPFLSDMGEALFRSICIYTAQSIYINEKKRSYDSALRRNLEDLTRQIYMHPQKDWNISEMAASIGVSKSTFFPMFKSFYGITPNEYIIKERIERSKIFLLQGMAISDVAAASGYRNVYHYIRQFHQKTGLTPKEYANLPDK